MHTAPTLRPLPWTRTWVLAFAASAALVGGSAANARASGALTASATKSDNYGHPYHWSPPC
jgi:hypothetical protein